MKRIKTREKELNRKYEAEERWHRGNGKINAKSHGLLLTITEDSTREGCSYIRANLCFIKQQDRVHNSIHPWRGYFSLTLFEGKGHKDTQIKVSLTKDDHDFPTHYKKMMSHIKKHLFKIDRELGRKALTFKPPSFAEFHARTYGIIPLTRAHPYEWCKECVENHREKKVDNEYIVVFESDEYVNRMERPWKFKTAIANSEIEAIGIVMKQNFKVKATSIDSLQLDQYKKKER